MGPQFEMPFPINRFNVSDVSPNVPRYAGNTHTLIQKARLSLSLLSYNAEKYEYKAEQKIHNNTM